MIAISRLRATFTYRLMMLIYFYLVVSHHFLFDFVIFHWMPTVCRYHYRPPIPISQNFHRLFQANSFLSLRFAQDIRRFQPILFQRLPCVFQSISKIKRNYSETNRSMHNPFPHTISSSSVSSSLRALLFLSDSSSSSLSELDFDPSLSSYVTKPKCVVLLADEIYGN